MIIPAAMHIEAAIDSLKKQLPNVRISEMSELTEVGSARVQAIGARGMTADLLIGYVLGIETARTWLALDPKASAAKLEF